MISIIIGGAGFIGSHLEEHLAEKTWDFFAYHLIL